MWLWFSCTYLGLRLSIPSHLERDFTCKYSFLDYVEIDTSKFDCLGEDKSMSNVE
jgi:hypothetical protein